MSTSAATLRGPSLTRLSLHYSVKHRRLPIYVSGFLVAETLWFAYAGYRLRGIPQQFSGFEQLANGNSPLATSFAQLTQCAAKTCATAFNAPPWYINPITNVFIYLLPAICALVFVAPSLARELESKSVRFSWTQAISRRQWLTSRMIPGLFAAFVISAAGEIEARRWIFPHSYRIFEPWQMFPFGGSATVAIAMFLVAFAILSSLILRRPTAVLILTAIVYGGAVLFISSTYPTLLTPKTKISPQVGLGIPQGALYVRQISVNKVGIPVSKSYMNNVFKSCSIEANSGGTQTQSTSPTKTYISPVRPFNEQTYANCFTSHDLYSKYFYQPSFRFWELQWIYTAMAGGAALLLIGSSFWLVTRIEP